MIILWIFMDFQILKNLWYIHFENYELQVFIIKVDGKNCR